MKIDILREIFMRKCCLCEFFVRFVRFVPFVVRFRETTGLDGANAFTTKAQSHKGRTKNEKLIFMPIGHGRLSMVAVLYPVVTSG